MSEFLLVRHGETEWNREERFRGRTDLALTPRGRSQADAAARAIARRWPHVTAVYSSGLRRAMDTARPVARRLGVDVRAHPGLMDADYGDWQGKTPVEARRLYPDAFALWLSNPLAARFPGGESLADAQARFLAMVDELAAVYPDQTLALVSHVAVSRAALCALLGCGSAAFWRLDLRPASVSAFRADSGQYIVTLVNDVCHLHGIE